MLISSLIPRLQSITEQSQSSLYPIWSLFFLNSQFWPSYDFALNFPISQKVTDEGETDDFISAPWIEYHSSPSYTSHQLAHFQNIKTRIKYPQINILPIVYVN